MSDRTMKYLEDRVAARVRAFSESFAKETAVDEFVRVPVNPTRDMRIAGIEATEGKATSFDVTCIWHAMLEAVEDTPSPEPRAVEGEEWLCGCGECTVTAGEQCPGCGIFGASLKPAANPAPAPLTEDERYRVSWYANQLFNNRDIKNPIDLKAIQRALAIADHYRDQCGGGKCK